MSRHSFFPKREHSYYVVVVGWDRMLQSFFFQYGDPGSDLPLILATGQRPAEHTQPDVIVALATHFGSPIPPDLSTTLLADRQSEGKSENIAPPTYVTFTTQADNGDELSLQVGRDKLTDLSGVGALAEWIIDEDSDGDEVDEREEWDRTVGPTLGTA